MNATISEQVFYDSNRNPFNSWTIFSKEGPGAARVRYKPGNSTESTLLELSALTGSPMGLNLRVPGIRGRVTFDYKVLDVGTADPEFVFFVIPAKTSSEDPLITLEVGGNQAGDTRNVFPPLRAHYLIPATSRDGQWHTQEVEFNFSHLPDASFAIVAPRVNEGTGSIAPGRLLLRNVVVKLAQ